MPIPVFLYSIKNVQKYANSEVPTLKPKLIQNDLNIINNDRIVISNLLDNYTNPIDLKETIEELNRLQIENDNRIELIPQVENIFDRWSKNISEYINWILAMPLWLGATISLFGVGAMIFTVWFNKKSGTFQAKILENALESASNLIFKKPNYNIPNYNIPKYDTNLSKEKMFLLGLPLAYLGLGAKMLFKLKNK